MSQAHPAFDFIRQHAIPALNIGLEEYRHRGTGAVHYHLAAEDDQNAFLVAFRTVPQDSSGVAHILEHTSLCGSRKYPVRDPFFMMTRRSLNTFMNAFTASDWTAYPFATRNRKDFDNLLDVYLDAVFFPSLNELDFLQEGHRVEFAEPGNPDSELVYKGVVYNEMKGAMSAPVSTLYQTMTRELFPSITYHHNSGGDPAHIPDLSYQQLKAFHARHYHPSNAVFMTYGDIPAAAHQAHFEQGALQQFDALDLNIAVPDEQRYRTPVQVDDHYALDGEEDTEDKTHIVVGWLLDNITDAEALMRGHLLSGVLLDNGASPLRHALETTKLGCAPSPLCGLSDSSREMFFVAGLEGSNPEHAEAVENLILAVLEKVASEGVPQDTVEAVLHQLELSQREISGDGFPFGLQLMVHGLGPILHGAAAIEAIDIDPVLARLREQIKDPEFIKGLACKLLNNPHRVRLVMRPDPQLSEQQSAAEAARLAAIKAGMDDAAKQQVIHMAEQLLARQNQQDDPEVLPRVGLEDVPAELSIPTGQQDQLLEMPATSFARGTNGLVYQQVVVELPALADELVELLPLYTELLPELGYGELDYLQAQSQQAAVTGGIGASVGIRGAVDDVQRDRSYFTLSGKALLRNHTALAEIMHSMFTSARFDELPRIRELVAQERMYREQRVTSAGHSLAMAAASSGLAPNAALQHRWSGLAGIKALKALDDSLDEPKALEKLAEQLAAIHQQLSQAPRQLLLIGEAEHLNAQRDSLSAIWQQRPAIQNGTAFAAPAAPGRLAQAWTTSTQVNFCARAYPCVAAEHEDAPALTVLAAFLRNNYLHRAIREQGGAYGGGASFDVDSGAFRFYSYRDPRLGETLADFDQSVQWLLENQHEWRLVEEAILGIVSNIDKPGSPAGEAKKTFHGNLHGRTPEQRRRYRARILAVREADIKRVAETYLKPEQASTVVITDAQTLEKHPELGLERVKL
ncbi:MAG: insulinase family protein [Chromatiales bacterium]|nr:insulinase family protein [Chromatiales bacterium]